MIRPLRPPAYPRCLGCGRPHAGGLFCPDCAPQPAWRSILIGEFLALPAFLACCGVAILWLVALS